MARLQLAAMGRLFWLCLALLPAALAFTFDDSAASDDSAAQSLYEQPVLVIDEGRHSALIRCASVANDGRFATGSEDKTVRIWSLELGTLLRTIRVPAGAGNIGKIYAVAMSPDG